MKYKKTEEWVNHLLANGRYAFTLKEFRMVFFERTLIANKFALQRLVNKGLIVSIYKGYYLLIPAQYQSRGMLPPNMFLDAFMKELDRPYYLALINAAGFHGAAHQQPQEFFVVTCFPVLRPMQKKGIKINYLSKKEIPSSLLDIRKTEAGYIKISNPALTAIDLIQYHKRIGGITRAASVLAELAEQIQPDAFNVDLLHHAPVTSFQRLGYILDKIIGQQTLANALYEVLQHHQAHFFRVPLKASAKTEGFAMNERWKVIVNVEIEIDQ
jgi:predicted transcriptional regulator of viral defense system